MDDCIILGRHMHIVDSVIKSLQKGNKDFELTDKGSINKYLGVKIDDINENSFEMSQPFLVQCLIHFFGLDKNKTRGRDTPVSKSLLTKDLDVSPCKHTWLYQNAVGMMSYLWNSVRPKI